MDLSKSYEYFQPEKCPERLHIIGCGSVGSTVAENLVRTGLTNFTLYDFDRVESHNLANQMFRQEHIGTPKVEALLAMLAEINPDVTSHTVLESEGWHGQRLNGYVFLCVDDIELRREIVEANMSNPYIRAMFDFRTGLEDAQHNAADWADYKMKKDFLASMNFSRESAIAATPVSACNVALCVAPTVRIICAYGVANFMNFVRGNTLKKLILADAFNFSVDAF